MSLSREQRRALEALLAPGPRVQARATSVAADVLKTWLGVSHDELQTELGRLWGKKAALERGLLDWAERNPLDAAFQFIAGAALGFYAAEKGVNPKINTYIDAFYYIATCASVGYADIFAMTQTGRAIAALVMTVGPALAAKSLDKPASRMG